MSDVRSESRPAAAPPARALVALGVALLAAVAGAVFVRRAARHMPPLPPAGAQPAAGQPTAPPARQPAAPSAGGGGARPEYPRLQ
ncbi:hypothetical protein [Roseisolibacter agri]|uniref:Uncharacterized protein n=1 Tax=Roseisolibacter agri TaxID=2014610 RepID=A0AA37V473_9BACT|nr:hypothetical protein [Roseisolibacter agri]GLC27552.1 hypothetical protein rosag_40650 [Roseisolibacter agri]